MRLAISYMPYAIYPGVAERFMRRSVKPFYVGSTPTPWTPLEIIEEFITALSFSDNNIFIVSQKIIQ